MKKIILLLMIFLLGGCTNLNNTPTKRVEELMNNYQSLADNVLTQLDEVVKKEESFDESQKQIYKDIIKKQYKNLTYKIKDETIDGNTAIVTVEIEVLDYNKVLKDAKTYYELHKEEFLDNNNEYETKYIDYRLDKLKNTDEKVTYTLEINLTKKDKEWTVDTLTSENLDKINGTYNY